MRTPEFVQLGTPLRIILGWEGQPPDTPILGIVPLGIVDRHNVRFVLPGKGFVEGSRPEVAYLVSEGFMCCSALVLHNRQNGAFKLAHVEPIDELRNTIQKTPTVPGEEAFFLYGTNSEPAYEINNHFSQRGIPQRVERVATGDKHFGIVVETATGLVSVVRKSPDRSILQYHPFDTTS